MAEGVLSILSTSIIIIIIKLEDQNLGDVCSFT